MTLLRYFRVRNPDSFLIIEAELTSDQNSIDGPEGEATPTDAFETGSGLILNMQYRYFIHSDLEIFNNKRPKSGIRNPETRFALR